MSALKWHAGRFRFRRTVRGSCNILSVRWYRCHLHAFLAQQQMSLLQEQLSRSRFLASIFFGSNPDCWFQDRVLRLLPLPRTDSVHSDLHAPDVIPTSFSERFLSLYRRHGLQPFYFITQVLLTRHTISRQWRVAPSQNRHLKHFPVITIWSHHRISVHICCMHKTRLHYFTTFIRGNDCRIQIPQTISNMQTGERH